MTRFSSPYKVSLILLLFLSAILAGLNCFPEIKDHARSFFNKKTRLVLATVKGDLSGKGTLVSIVKVRSEDSLSLEAYEVDVTTGRTLFRGRVILPEKRDGYFDYQGNATNLALVDVDHDGCLEVLAPAYDENLIPRLHVFKFDYGNGNFLPLKI